VGLDGLEADEQLGGDLLVRVAAREQPQHLALARGEPVELLVRHRRLGPERVEHEPREARREHRVAVGDPAYGGGQLLGGHRLGDVAAGAGADDRDDVLGRVGHRQRQEPGRRLPDALEHGDATAVGHVHVEQHDVGLEPADDLHRLGHRGGLPDDVDELADLGTHPGPEELVVVDEHDPHLISHGAAPAVPRCRCRPST
jgi:hypothetical protein